MISATRRQGVLVMALGALVTIASLGACGGGGDNSSSDPITTGLTASFVPDSSPACASAADGLSLRTITATGALLTLGMRVTDCDQSLGIYGVTFDMSFDPAVVRCASSYPCTAGGLLPSSPSIFLTCQCDNNSGEILGVITRQNPALNDGVGVSGQDDIVLITMQALVTGSGRIDFTNGGSANGSALMTLPTNTAGEIPVAIPGLVYVGGSLVAQ